MGVSARTQHARALFAPLGPTYDRYAGLLSFGQDPRWRSFLVSKIDPRPEDVVLDIATGTAAVAIAIVRRYGCHVVGLDQSPEMLAVARQRLAAAGLAERVRLVEGRAEDLPFDSDSFAALTFTYLLRYVDDPAATLTELVRVVRPGGTVASLEFGIPPHPLWRALWQVYVDVGLPGLGRTISSSWHEVGRFLGGSIRDFHARYPLERLVELWAEAGVENVQIRRLTMGSGVAMWGRCG